MWIATQSSSLNSSCGWNSSLRPAEPKMAPKIPARTRIPPIAEKVLMRVLMGW